MRSPSRLAMGAGFAVLLVLVIAMVGAGFTHARAVQDELEALHRDYAARSENLREFGLFFLLTGIELRDALLVRSSDGTTRFEAARGAAVQRLAGLADSGELKAELDKYWGAAEAAFANPTSENLRSLSNHRKSVGAVVVQLDRLNKEVQATARQRIFSMRAANRRFFLLLLAVALAVGLATAAFSWRRVGALESQAAVHEAELVRLSRSVVRAQEDERRTIARELHDELGQQLTGMGMLLGSLPRHREDPDRFVSLVDEARRLNVQTLRSVRTLALGLRPSLLDDLGLQPALEWFAREFSRRSGVPVYPHLEGDLSTIPEPHRTALYRIVQESLTNAARHSRASRIDLHLSVREGTGRLVIEDNGVGFNPKGATAQGQGLLGVSERVAELGGHFQIDSQPGRGARLTVAVPVPEPQEAAT